MRGGAAVVVYLDVLFFTNVLMDWVTLLAAARLAGAAVHRGRFVLACLLGGTYAVLAALFPALGVLPVRAAMGAALCLAAFGGERTLLRLGGLYFVTAAAFAGLAYALGAASGRRLLYGAGYYFTVPLGLLLLAAAVGYAVSGVLLRGDAAHGCVRQEILPLTVQFGGRERRVRVLRDSGHTLTEPVSGKPVLILCRGEAALLLNDPLDGDATQQLTSLPPETACRCGLRSGQTTVCCCTFARTACRRRTEARATAYAPSGLRSSKTANSMDLSAYEREKSMKLYKILTLLRQLRRLPSVYYIGGSDILPPPLSPEEEAEAAAACQTGDENARRRLIEHNLRLVVFLARKFESSGVGTEDLISIGTIGLIKAVSTYRSDRKVKLATYASRCIENEILMYLRKIAGRRTEVSFDEPLSSDWDGNELLLSDILGTEPDSVIRPLEDDVDRVLLLRALSHLPPREREIISMRFGIDLPESMTQKEVADRLGISQSYISRLEKRIIAKMRRDIVSQI